MKKVLIAILIFGCSPNLFSQSRPSFEAGKSNSLTFGILQGGGSLIGADLEFLVGKKFGIQLGGGFLGYGAGLNYHFKPSIRSSFISFQYWHQGIGDSFTQSAVGPNFVFRGKKWFTFQIGLGFRLKEGPNFPFNRGGEPILLLYSIGAYTPI